MITNNKGFGQKFLQGGGELGQIISDMDWSQHTLGMPAQWPVELKITLSNILKTAFPKFIFWGTDLICFYNDAYRPSLGMDGKHPSIIGEKAEVAWPEIWDTIKPLIDQVQTTGKPVWSENQLIPIYRNGRIENVYWTFSYSALLGEDENFGGILVTCFETTEAILSLQKLKESEDQLKFAIDAAELGTWNYNPQKNKFNGNERLKNWFGISKGKNIDLDIAIQTVQYKDRNRVAETIKNALENVNGGKYDLTFTIGNRKTGRLKIVRALGKAWFNDSGEAYRVNGTMQDVTEQEKFDKELSIANFQIRKERERFKDIIQNAPVGIAIFNGLECVFEMANPSILEILDKTSEELVGRELFTALPEIETKVRPLFEEVFRNREPVVATEFNLPIKRQGTIENAYFDFILKPITKGSDDVIDVILITNEVTNYVVARNTLEENESQFKNLVLQSPVAKAIFRGKDLKIEMANYRMLGHFWKRTWNEVIGKNFSDVFPELIGQNFISELRSVIGTGHAIRNQESKAIFHKNGEKFEFYVDYVYLPLCEEDGSVSGVMITMTDVTHQFVAKLKLTNFSKELEKEVIERTALLNSSNEKLLDSIKKLEIANDELESFAYVSSHDLQEPLRKIQMFVSRIEDKEQRNLTETGKKYFEKIAVSANRMRILIDDLLAFSRTEEKRREFKPTDLNEVLKQVLEDLSGQIETKGARISRSNLPIVNAVPFQMRQVFSNLLGNSLKFAKANVWPVIEVSSQPAKHKELEKLGLDTGKIYYKIIVKDNGIGFAEEMADQIFEVFRRLHDKSEYEGTGMGLSIVKKIIANHDGAINASGTDSSGAVFTIYLSQ